MGYCAQTYSRTKGLDNIAGTSGNDTIIGSVDLAANVELNTLSPLDIINGGAGVDTLKIADNLGNLIALPNVSNVEIIEVQATGVANINTAAVAGVTNLNVTKAAGAVTATAAATTDVGVSVKGIAGTTVVVNGGKDVNVTTTDAAATIDVGATGTDPVGAVTISATGAAAVNNANPIMGNIAVGGGKTVSVTQKATSGASAIVADGTTETVTQGNVVVTANATTTDVTLKQDAAVAPLSRAAVTGATEVSSVKFTKLDAGESVTISGLTFTAAAGKNLTADQVAQAFANLSASAIKPTQIAPASTATGDTQGSGANANGTFTGALLADWTSGAATADTVVFTGKANTAMTNLVATAKATVTPTTDGVTAVTAQNTLGVINGTVTIAGAAALKTVTVDGYGASSAITGATNTALDTISLANGAGFTISNAAATLGLTLANVNGTVDVQAGTKTLNAAVSHAKATDLTTLVSASAETVNVTGTGNVAGTTATGGLTAATAINTSGMTGGKATFTIADGTKTSYTGGAGVDTVTVTNADTAITKAINLGAGDDKLTLNGAVAVKVPTVTLDGGAGTNTIAMNAVSAESLSQSNAFAGKIDNFQKLEITDAPAAARVINMANMDGIKHVISNGSNGTGAGKQVETITLSGNFVAGNTVAIQVNALTAVSYTVIANDLTADGVGGGVATAAQVLTNVAAKVAAAIQADVPSAAVVDAAVVAGTPGALTLTADNAGAAFTATKVVVSPVAKQVQTLTLSGDYIAGDKVSVMVNALAPVEYTVVANDLTINGDGTGGAANQAQIQGHVATKLAAAIQANVPAAAVVDAAKAAGSTLTLTADVAGTAFTVASAATSSATKQVETVTLSGDYTAGDSVSITINALGPVTYNVIANDLTVNGDGTGGVATAAQIRANVAAKLVAAIQGNVPSAAVVDAAVVAGTPGALTLAADVTGTAFAVTQAAVTTAAKQVTGVQLSGSYAAGDTVTVKVNNLAAVTYTVIANDLTADGVGGGVATAAQVLTNVAAKVAAAIQADVPSAAVVDAAVVAGTPGALTLAADVAGTPFAVTQSTTAGFGQIAATVTTPNSTGDGDVARVTTTANKAAGAAVAANTTPNKLLGDAVVATTTANDAAGSALLTFDKMANDGTLEMVDNAAHTSSGAIIKMADATGSTDSFNVVTKLSTVASTFGTVDVAGVETLKLNAVDTAPTVTALGVTSASIQTATLTLKADKATSLTIEGNSNVELFLNAATNKLATIDAGTLTGSLLFDANQGAVAMTITGGLGADILKASVGTLAKADVINGGAGNDTIYAGSNGAKLTGGAGNDLFIVTASSATVGNKESNTYSEILDFQAGDVLQLQAFVGAATADATGFTKLAAVLNDATAQFSDFANAAVKEAGVGGAVWFNFKGDAYVVVDSGANTDAFVNGEDLVVKLTGINGDNLSWNGDFATVALV